MWMWTARGRTWGSPPCSRRTLSKKGFQSLSESHRLLTLSIKKSEVPMLFASLVLDTSFFPGCCCGLAENSNRRHKDDSQEIKVIDNKQTMGKHKKYTSLLVRNVLFI